MKITAKTQDGYFRAGVKALLDAWGMTQAELAEKVGMGPVAMSRIVTGNRQSLVGHQWAIAEAFRMTPEQVMQIGLKAESGEIEERAGPIIPPNRADVAIIIDEAIKTIESQECFPGRSKVADWIALAIVEWIARGCTVDTDKDEG